MGQEKRGMGGMKGLKNMKEKRWRKTGADGGTEEQAEVEWMR